MAQVETPKKRPAAANSGDINERSNNLSASPEGIFDDAPPFSPPQLMNSLAAMPMMSRMRPRSRDQDDVHFIGLDSLDDDDDDSTNENDLDNDLMMISSRPPFGMPAFPDLENLPMIRPRPTSFVPFERISKRPRVLSMDDTCLSTVEDELTHLFQPIRLGSSANSSAKHAHDQSAYLPRQSNQDALTSSKRAQEPSTTTRLHKPLALPAASTPARTGGAIRTTLP